MRVCPKSVLVALSPPLGPTLSDSGRVLSPLLYNFLVNGLASVCRAAPGVQFGVSHRFTDQLYVDDLVLTAECQT